MDKKEIASIASKKYYQKNKDKIKERMKNYYNNNTNQGYCRYVIGPKLEKFEKVFKDRLK